MNPRFGVGGRRGGASVVAPRDPRFLGPPSPLRASRAAVVTRAALPLLPRGPGVEAGSVRPWGPEERPTARSHRGEGTTGRAGAAAKDARANQERNFWGDFKAFPPRARASPNVQVPPCGCVTEARETGGGGLLAGRGWLSPRSRMAASVCSREAGPPFSLHLKGSSEWT